MESLENKKYYRWISGPDQGTVEVYLAEDETGRVWFESGNSVEKERIEQLMHETNEQEYLSRLIQPSPDHVYAQYEQMINPQLNSIAPPSPTIQKEKSAVQIIIEKQKKLNDIELNIKIPVKLPNEKAIEFMTVMFDEDEVIDEISNFVKDQVTNEIIMEMIKDAIKLRVSICSDPQGE
jgi:hypothetical protein